MVPLAKRTPRNPTHQLPTSREHLFIRHIWTKLLEPGTVRECKIKIHIHPAPNSL